jgi:hypothetical protein
MRSHFRTTTTTKLPHRSLHRSSKDERTVTTACPQPGTENGLQRLTDLEGQTRAQLIMARRADLHRKAEYICADLSSRPNFPLQSCGGPYIPDTNRMPGCLSDQGLCILHAQALIAFDLRRPVSILHSVQAFALLTGISNSSSVDRSCYGFEALDRPDRLEIALFGNRGTA